MTARRPGPAPKPTEIKKLEGNPGKRSLKDAPIASKPTAPPPVPSNLGPVGRAAWSTYWSDGFAWLSKVDAPMVYRLCRLHDLAEDIDQALRAEKSTHQNETTGRSALHSIANNLIGLYGRMDQMASLLGFDPSNRSRIKVERPPADALGDWEQSA